ncbi:DinB family protein [Rubripirellula amarantea]|uniref:DinB superfamily protein n=1 Tax=Rubripirellula amarantea TaxID=2527999 RepID=A0A5C5WTV7_9BACT|nr:DinB family protein [Rubripirellula amarantea]MDA8745298.1 DinB family protein [Rubripirellula amarantea]TWT53998.1 DinB superfamily protein [Rubripirellula amarantea]
MALASCRPDSSECSHAYHQKLVNQVDGEDALSVLRNQQYWICELGSFLCTEQVDKIHPPFGWTVRQVFEHCADAERIFGYRILRAAAGDSTGLSSWDENHYADARFGLGTFTNLITELGLLRQSNLLLLQRIAPRCWSQTVPVDGAPISVRAMAWVTAGHLAHHLNIVEKRCGVAVQRTPSM